MADRCIGIGSHSGSDIFRYAEEVALGECMNSMAGSLCSQCRALTSLPGAAAHLRFFDLCDSCTEAACKHIKLGEKDTAKAINDAIRLSLTDKNGVAYVGTVMCTSRTPQCYQALVACLSNGAIGTSAKRSLVTNRAYFDGSNTCTFIGSRDEVNAHARKCRINPYCSQ